jgi:heme ABC exporter ATP-binding subunit CcmA
VASSGTRGDATGWVPPMTVQVAWHVAMEPLVDPDAPAGEAPVVDLVEVVAVLGTFPALAGASLVVRRGEIVLLRGPNGAGKTTLLRVCAGLVPLARGDGRVAGCDLRTQRQAVRSRVGLLGHANGLYSDLTVRQNVAFWGATVGASADEIQASLERLGLAARLADLPVGRLSAGQKRRTALACLVARRSQVWLLDEPHAGLDATGRDDLDATLRAAVTAGATVIVASHELDRAGSLATRVVDVIGGQVHEGGHAPGMAPGSP